MPNVRNASELLVELVQAESVTPNGGPAFDVLQRHLAPAGFAVDRPVFDEPGAPSVENLFAAIGEGERHLVFAGHVDVVPPGAEVAGATRRSRPRSRTASSTGAAPST